MLPRIAPLFRLAGSGLLLGFQLSPPLPQESPKMNATAIDAALKLRPSNPHWHQTSEASTGRAGRPRQLLSVAFIYFGSRPCGWPLLVPAAFDPFREIHYLVSGTPPPVIFWNDEVRARLPPKSLRNKDL